MRCYEETQLVFWNGLQMARLVVDSLQKESPLGCFCKMVVAVLEVSELTLFALK